MQRKRSSNGPIHFGRGDYLAFKSIKIALTRMSGTMRAYILVAVFFLTYVCSAVAAPDVEGYDSATIRVADVPTNAPAFEAYPAKIYVGRNANLRLGTDPD